VPSHKSFLSFSPSHATFTIFWPFWLFLQNCGKVHITLKYVVVTTLEWTVQWCLVSSHCCLTFASLWFQNIFVTPLGDSITIKQSCPPLPSFPAALASTRLSTSNEFTYPRWNGIIWYVASCVWHWAWYFPGSSMLWQESALYSLLWLKRIPLWG